MTSYKLFIDESGQLGGKEHYFVVMLLLITEESYKKWVKLSETLLNQLNRLRDVGKCQRIEEIKAYYLSPAEKQMILNKILKVGIRFSLFAGVIDKSHPHFIEKFGGEGNNTGNQKELAVNYILGKLLTTPNLLTKLTPFPSIIDISMDWRYPKIFRCKSLQSYLNEKVLANTNPDLAYKINYQDSKKCKGVQLADFFANIVFAKCQYNRSQHLYKTIQNNIVSFHKYPNF